MRSGGEGLPADSRRIFEQAPTRNSCLGEGFAAEIIISRQIILGFRVRTTHDLLIPNHDQ